MKDSTKKQSGPPKAWRWVTVGEVLAAGAIMSAQPGQAQPEPKRPNILIIVADDMGWSRRAGISARGVLEACSSRLLSGRVNLPFAGHALECVNPASVEVEP